MFCRQLGDKASNLRRIAKELNIGTDSLVFVDDNPAEREIVRRYMPEVEVIELPEDPALYVRALNDALCFELPSLSLEDAGRSSSYAANRERDVLAKEAVDYPAYLKSLQMRATTGPVTNLELTRFVQLINKSNQFNLRTQRYTNAAVLTMCSDADRYAPIFVSLEDRFTNYGIISCLVLEHRRDVAFIDTWVMSCRVLKRGAEDVAFNALLCHARFWGCRYLVGEYIATQKNNLVRHLLPDMGFELCDGEYRLDIRSACHRHHYIQHAEANSL